MGRERGFFFFIFLSFLLVLLDLFGFLKGIKGETEKIVLPVKGRFYQLVLFFRREPEAFFQRWQEKNCPKEKEALEKLNRELSLQVNLLSEENKDLRRQLEAPLPSSFRFLPAPVISLSRFLEIGVGEKDRVKKEMVVVYGLAVVGKVFSLGEKSSLVKILTDGEMELGAKTSRGARGKVVGQFGETILLTKVLQKDPLFLGDQVLTSGEDNFPPNLLIGEIVYLQKEEAAVYQQAKIAPAVNFQKTERVFLLW